ncbi:MAG: hypothetical protein FWD61_06690 [Phycisphaerales bacterium]|nr:hypothetical protein [Phycisphaerales bacterium]
MEKRCDRVRNQVLGPRALAVISCALALLAAQPVMATPCPTAMPAKAAKVEMLGQLMAFELFLEPLAIATDLVSTPSCRVSVMDREIGLSLEQRFTIEQHLLAPPMA